MEIVEKPRIGVVGGGSWATAIAKMLTENNGHINWFMRNIESIKAFKVLKHNPRYLCGVDFDIDRISFSDDRVCHPERIPAKRGNSKIASIAER